MKRFVQVAGVMCLAAFGLAAQAAAQPREIARSDRVRWRSVVRRFVERHLRR